MCVGGCVRVCMCVYGCVCVCVWVWLCTCECGFGSEGGEGLRERKSVHRVCARIVENSSKLMV